MLRESGSGVAAARARGKRLGADRVWHAVAVSPMPPEPGRAIINAAVSLSREAEELSLWHDSIETSCNVLRRVLWGWRTGRGEASGTYAASAQQILWAVARAGVSNRWERPPHRMNSREGLAYFRQHRKSLQRWLERLQAAGVIRCGGTRDAQGYWWRLEIELLHVHVDAERLAAARERMAGWDERRRRSVRGGEAPKRSLDHALRGCLPPTRRERQKRGIARQVAIKAARRRGIHHSGDLTHPYGAKPPYGASKKPRQKTEDASREHSPLVNKRGVRKRPRPGTPDNAHSLRSKYPSQPEPLDKPLETFLFNENWVGADDGGEGLSGFLGVERHPFLTAEGSFQASEGHLAGDGSRSPAWHQRQAQMAESAPVGSPLTPALLEAIVHGFHCRRYGADSAAADPRRPRMPRAELERIIRMYERYADRRPPGWPKAGPAALLTFATYDDPATLTRTVTDEFDASVTWNETQQRLQRPKTLAGAAKRLLLLARQMRALSTTPEQLRRATDRARNRANAKHDVSPTAQRIAFRQPMFAAILESDATRRERIRDQLALAGDHPIHYATLEAAELALIEHEALGRLPHGIRPAPAMQRAARGAPMPTWWTPPRPDIGPETTWALILDAINDRIDETTHDLWLTQLQPLHVIGDRLTLSGPDHIVRWTAQRYSNLLQTTAVDLDVARAIGWQLENGDPLHLTPPTRTELAAGTDGRRKLGDRYLTDIKRERWRLRRNGRRLTGE